MTPLTSQMSTPSGNRYIFNLTTNKTMENRDLFNELSMELHMQQNRDASPFMEDHKNYNQLFFYQYQGLKEKCSALKQIMDTLNKKREELWQSLIATEVQTQREFSDGFRTITYEKKLRIRKPQHKINRVNQCNIGNCSKAYGSLGSLIQHQTIKHPQEYHRRREERKQARSSTLEEISLSS